MWDPSSSSSSSPPIRTPSERAAEARFRRDFGRVVRVVLTAVAVLALVGASFGAAHDDRLVWAVGTFTVWGVFMGLHHALEALGLGLQAEDRELESIDRSGFA